jgi:hypothetical protein
VDEAEQPALDASLRAGSPTAHKARKRKAEIHRTKLDIINQVFSDLKADGRAVLMI